MSIIFEIIAGISAMHKTTSQVMLNCKVRNKSSGTSTLITTTIDIKGGAHSPTHIFWVVDCISETTVAISI